MQLAFQEPTSDWCVPRYDEAAVLVGRLAAACHRRTVWTRFVRDPHEQGAWSAYYDRWASFRLAADSPTWDLTFAVPTEEPVVSLPTFSKWGPELAAATASDQPLIVCGVATDCCVLSTVLGAVDAGRSVVVATDACAAVSDEAQMQTLALLDLLYPMVRLATTEEVLAHL